jgi:hypothetical protein
MELINHYIDMVGDPKRIMRRIITIQNSQRKIKTLRMASVEREREKIQTSQNSLKMA